MTGDRWWHGGGVVLGLLIAVTAAYQPVTAASNRLGADVQMSAAPTGELDVTPRGSFLTAEGLRVGEHATGRVSVRNQTGATLSVTTQFAAPPSEFLGLHVRLRAGSETVVDGTFDESGGGRPWLLESGRTVDVSVEVWVAPTDEGRHVGAIDIGVRFETQLASA